MIYKFKDLIKESNLVLEGRKEDAKGKYERVPEEVYDLFVEMDPSSNHKYIDWLMKTWERDKCKNGWGCNRLNEARKLMEDITYFHNNTHKYDQSDINNFPTIYELGQRTIDARIKLTKGELKKQANKLYDTGRYLVVEPESHGASCYYGAGTQWCTTMKNNPGYFNQYFRNSSLFYFINKKTGKKRAFLTSLQKPMFGPSRYAHKDWMYAGEKEYDNYPGTIYTETDREGRSFAGIPVEAREAMFKAHKEKAIKWVKDLPDDNLNKFKQMTAMGLEDVPAIKVVGGWNTAAEGPIPPSVEIVESTFIVDSNDGFGNVKYVGGLTLSENVSKVSSIEWVKGTIKINSKVDMGSIKGKAKHNPENGIIEKQDGFLTSVSLHGEYPLVTNWGLINQLQNLRVTKIRRGFFTMMNQVDVDSLTFNSSSAREALTKAFKGVNNIEISNYFY